MLGSECMYLWLLNGIPPYLFHMLLLALGGSGLLSTISTVRRRYFFLETCMFRLLWRGHSFAREPSRFKIVSGHDAFILIHLYKQTIKICQIIVFQNQKRHTPGCQALDTRRQSCHGLRRASGWRSALLHQNQQGSTKQCWLKYVQTWCYWIA